jgi:hypothetical protein
MPVPVSLCTKCKHFHNQRLDANVCDAFPGGIPLDIIFMEFKHIAPYEGDHGIQFEPAEPISNTSITPEITGQ